MMKLWTQAQKSQAQVKLLKKRAWGKAKELGNSLKNGKLCTKKKWISFKLALRQAMMNGKLLLNKLKEHLKHLQCKIIWSHCPDPIYLSRSKTSLWQAAQSWNCWRRHSSQSGHMWCCFSKAHTTSSRMSCRRRKCKRSSKEINTLEKSWFSVHVSRVPRI